MSYNENDFINEDDVIFIEVFAESFRNVLNVIVNSLDSYKFKFNLCRGQIYEEKKAFLLNVINNPSIMDNLGFLSEIRAKIVRNF